MNLIGRIARSLFLHQRIAADVQLGKFVFLGPFINLYGCEIGDESRIGSFVEVQRGARIGKRCKISSHSFIPDGVTIGDGVFVGHGVMFVNDQFPRAVRSDGKLENASDWRDRFVRTVVQEGAVIGSNATILGGLIIGSGALVGAGAVVTRNVAPGETVVGNPARPLCS